ncbi:hypothetical protein LguiB_027347 [Lonicera macranthoides]
MKKLEILDLSRNQLFGAIPIGLGSLNSLSVLDLSLSNFLGNIPLSTQLDTFDGSVYAGNDKLCRLPLPMCSEDESTLFPPPNDHGKAEVTIVTTEFYVSVVLGFAIGFWGFIGQMDSKIRTLVLKFSTIFSFEPIWNRVASFGSSFGSSLES